MRGIGTPPLKNLVDLVLDKMVDMQYSDSYVNNHRSVSEKLMEYAHGVGADHMSEELQKAFLHDVYEVSQKTTIIGARCFLRALLSYQQSGEIRLEQSRGYEFPEGLCAAFEEYLEPKQVLLRNVTIQSYRCFLKRLACFLVDNGVHSLSDVTKETIVNFTLSLSELDGQSSNRIITVVADLLSYGYEHGYISEDLSKCCMRARYYKGDRIPVSFTKEEIERTLSVIDRNTALGKRDYAMIMLASRTGLRGRDIMDLKLQNLRFDTDTIELPQSKTGKFIVLPLTEEVGLALIEYLKSGRPESESEFIFLRHQAPHRPMIAGLHEQLRKYMELAGIPDLAVRSPGYRTLRHSLASNMLKANTPIYKIKDYLDHESINTTMRYIKIDQSQLRQCALEVPPLRY